MTWEPRCILEMSLGLNNIKDSLGQIILKSKVIYEEYRNMVERLSRQLEFGP